jgi:hypothetical protein
MSDLLERRTTAIGQSQIYWAVVVHTENGEARLEIHPTPSSADKIRIAYRARWTDLDSTSDESVTPDYADSALIACVRAFALGYEEEGLEVRLAEVESGPIYMRLMEKDGLVQPEYGQIRGGALSQVTSRFNLPWDSTADPS